ncbi:type II toxin-antitoxin system RelE/ParE family toxin [Lysobacter gummosus]|uniref:type II toxin-antitoxin system RelE/ParE family toxin n=1 Tax=Lysobacter gummosus TaxID=262324 RepID=UPI0036260D14
MNEIQTTETFDEWIADLGDAKARGIIIARIERMRAGNFGDSKSVGEGVSELRIDYGPGYRVYFTKRNGKTVILLCGGDKSSQKSDINLARGIATNM